MFRNVWSRKRMLAVCCIIAVLAGMLAGCSNKAGGTADETTAAAETAVETTAAETAAETTAEETAAAETAAVETAAETAAAEATAAGTTAAEMAAAGTEEAETTAAPESGETEAGAEDKAPTDKVADASEMTDVQEVVEEGMVPVYASGLKDGTYDVEMRSSSSMFKADHVQIVVENGSMSAVLYMTSKAYKYMFAGTGEEAAAAAEADYIPLEDAGDEMGTFTLPLEALDDGEHFAAYSVRKEKWYDRTLLFRADSLPADAFLEARYKTVSDLGLEDGEYTAEVTLEGGSGRASVESPAKLHIADGVCTAQIIWSSSNYDFMMVGDVQYDPVNTEGNSVFEIPVTGFDYKMPVQADTTAMSQPYLIDYTLYFDSASVTPAE